MSRSAYPKPSVPNPREIPRELQPVTGASRKPAVGTRGRPNPSSPLMSWKIAASLGSSMAEVKRSAAFSANPPRTPATCQVSCVLVVVFVLVVLVPVLVAARSSRLPRRSSSLVRRNRRRQASMRSGRHDTGSVGRLRLVAVGRRIGRPEMPAAARAHPELIRRPRHAGTGIAHFHFGAAALTTDLQVDVGHGRILCTLNG